VAGPARDKETNANTGVDVHGDTVPTDEGGFS